MVDMSEDCEHICKLVQILKHSREIVYIHNGDGVFEYVSPSVEQITGYTPHEWRANHASYLTNNPINHAAVARTQEALLTGNAQKPYYVEIYHKEGGKLFFEIFETPVVVEGEVTGIAGLARRVDEKGEMNGELLETRERYRNLLELSQEAIMIHDGATIQFINGSGAKLLGAKNPSQIIGLSILELVHPDYQDVKMTRIADVMSKKVVAPVIEEKLICLNGNVIDVEVASAYVPYKGKGAVLSLFHDVTERKAAEAELRREKDLREKVMDCAHSAIYALDMEGKFTFINRSGCEISGYTEEELVGKPFSGIVDPFEVGVLLGQFQKVSREGHAISRFHTTLVTKDGDRRKLILSASPLRTGDKINGVVGIAEDITEYKQLEEEQDKFFSLSPDMLCVLGFDGKLKKTNRAFADILGYAENELAEKPFTELIHPDDVPAISSQFEFIKNGASKMYFENRYRRREGGYRWLSWTAYPSVDEKLIYAIARDVTERKLAMEELRAAKEKAEEATRIKDKFVSLVAHDLRSPLTSIVGLLRIIISGGGANIPDPIRPILAQVIDSGDHMVSIIEELMNISRLKSGALAPKKRFLDGHSMAEIAANSMSHAASEKGIELVNEVPMGTRLYADFILFGEALKNLVSNAIKFSRKGDKVSIFTPKDQRTTIAVKDTGVGIGPDVAPFIFNQEVKTTREGTAGERGTGLGLPYSHDIMEAHGGSLTMESKEGEGSVFYASLPFVRPKLMIIDDDRIVRYVIRNFVTPLEVDIVEAENGILALKLVPSEQPHLIICDVLMPLMDGLEFIKKLRGNPLTERIPVIVATSDSKMETREKAIMTGADDFIQKPIAVEDFIPRIRKYII